MVKYKKFYGVMGVEDNKIYLSKSGYEQYLKELQELKDCFTSNGRSKSDAYSSAVGDSWHDNFAFEEAKREELRIQNLINQKVDQLKNIVIVEDLQDASLIEIDDYVDVELTYEGEEPEEMIFKLVGSNTPDINTVSSGISNAWNFSEELPQFTDNTITITPLSLVIISKYSIFFKQIPIILKKTFLFSEMSIFYLIKLILNIHNNHIRY